ncbi:hypothetical protein EDWATA_00376 [Edwardsiella tarda ATCC 23685]|uniref:N-acetyltransferase domain-containing protein n=1 Tax=Edwardsiella tarda ATCC 23685 TaxID=500638 RepID=D4F0Z6_EDWTA|nr:hypothetical protein [Edwardsiella tarda]EFE24656.1 hypothetical protein EDWATA_00376 [Edwardsiella tarda ATCC 23685]GAC65007.1 hypothetical protein ET1_14_00610 [Edwardsiella tarda ATCC 15947 = NBRC 105688]
MLLDNLKIPLAVGPINEDDYKILTTGYSELEWDNGFSRYGNRDDKFEFCIKLLSGSLKHIPAGAALCTYDEKASVIEIHFVESFVRREQDHPLFGRMFMITLWAVYLFGSAVGCQEIRIPEAVNSQVVDYYKKYGFQGDITLLTTSFVTLGDVVRSHIKSSR